MEDKTATTDSEKERKTRRNKHEVRHDLLSSVGKTLRDHGFMNLGINLVAKNARTDKNSIYRHFGSFEQLLDQYLETRDFRIQLFSPAEEFLLDDYKDFIKQILLEQYNAINNNKELQQLLIWELGELSLRTKAIAQRREELSKVILKQFKSFFSNISFDVNIMASILTAGIYYLILHKEHSTFCSVDCRKEKERIIEGINQLVDLLFKSMCNIKKQEQIAINGLMRGLDIQLLSELTELSLNHLENLKLKISE